jgi:WD40 repeat protein
MNAYDQYERKPKLITSCGHTYCESCLIQVEICPQCRKNIAETVVVYQIMDLANSDKGILAENTLDSLKPIEGNASSLNLAISDENPLNLHKIKNPNVGHMAGNFLKGKYIPYLSEYIKIISWKFSGNGLPLSGIVLKNDNIALGLDSKEIIIIEPEKMEEIKTFKGHQSYVTSLTQLPDGSLASGSADKTIRIWNLHFGNSLHVLEGHEDWVTSLVVLPNGSLASGSRDATIRIWNLNTRKAIKVLKGHNDWINCMVVLTNGSLATGSRDTSIRIWGTTKGKELKLLNNMFSNVSALAVLPLGNLASGSNDSIIRIWNTNNSSILRELTGHTKYIRLFIIINLI